MWSPTEFYKARADTRKLTMFLSVISEDFQGFEIHFKRFKPGSWGLCGISEWFLNISPAAETPGYFLKCPFNPQKLPYNPEFSSNPLKPQETFLKLMKLPWKCLKDPGDPERHLEPPWKPLRPSEASWGPLKLQKSPKSICDPLKPPVASWNVSKTPLKRLWIPMEQQQTTLIRSEMPLKPPESSWDTLKRSQNHLNHLLNPFYLQISQIKDNVPRDLLFWNPLKPPEAHWDIPETPWNAPRTFETPLRTPQCSWYAGDLSVETSLRLLLIASGSLLDSPKTARNAPETLQTLKPPCKIFVWEPNIFVWLIKFLKNKQTPPPFPHKPWHN